MTLSVLIGVLLTKELCQGFKCKTVATFKGRECVISIDHGKASTFGTTYRLKQFQWGEVDGWHGVNGKRTLTIFGKGNKAKSAYLAEYSGPETYARWKCGF